MWFSLISNVYFICLGASHSNTGWNFFLFHVNTRIRGKNLFRWFIRAFNVFFSVPNLNIKTKGHIEQNFKPFLPVFKNCYVSENLILHQFLAKMNKNREKGDLDPGPRFVVPRTQMLVEIYKEGCKDTE